MGNLPKIDCHGLRLDMQLLINPFSKFEMRTVRYAFFDGDNIGNAIENLLNSGRVKEATHLSESIKLAIFQIELFIKSRKDAELIIAGGDDVLIKYDATVNDYAFLQEVLNIFNNFTGLSMSCGAGDSVNQAITNLMSVKQQNKGGVLLTSEGIGTQNDSMKQTKLYIFVTSEIPDPYINVIAHCNANYRSLSQVTLVGITEDRGRIPTEIGKLERLRQNISDLLDNLCRSKYPKKVDGQLTLLDIQIEPADRQRYDDLKRLTLETKVLDYQILGEEISSLIHSTDSFKYIFDVTAVAKSYLVDVYTILRFKNVSDIYSFELFKKRDFDERDLIHNLVYRKTYGFTCLAETPHTENKIIVSETAIVTENEFNRLQADFSMLENGRNSLEDKVANDFARFWSLSYLGVLLSLFAFSSWIIAQPGGWNWLEPTIYIVPFAWFLLNFLLQIVFGGKAPSLNPKDLFPSLKSWKKKKLVRTRLANEKK